MKVKIKINKYLLDYLKQHNIFIESKSELIIPDKGFIEEYVFLKGDCLAQMGSFSYTYFSIPSGVRDDLEIGRYCSLGKFGFIRVSHPLNLISTSSFSYDNHSIWFKKCNDDYNQGEFETIAYDTICPKPQTTIIKDDVYICSDSLLKRGITLHTGCVVAERAVVTKDVPPYAIVAGVPARIVKFRFDEQTRIRLLKSKWWEYNFSDFKNIDLRLGVNEYLDKLELRINRQEIKPFIPQKVYFNELIERAKHNKIFLLQDSSNKAQATTNLSATHRIHNHLAYKLGAAMILNSKSLLGYIRMPYVLSYIKAQHRFEQEKYQKSIKKNPSLKLPKLESYPDYKEALKEKQCFTYKLGEALIKANSVRGGGQIFAYLAFFQEVRRLRQELKGKKKK